MAKVNLIKDSFAAIADTSGISRAGKTLSTITHKANRAIIPGGKNGIIFRNKAATLSNAYTGVGLTKLGVGLLALGAATKLGFDAYAAKKQVDASFKPQAEDLGSLSGMSQDAVGNVVRGKRDLGATGNLVFGLHAGNKKY